MAKEKDRNCLNCANLLNCPDIVGYSCRKHELAKPNPKTIGLLEEWDKRLHTLIQEFNEISIVLQREATLGKGAETVKEKVEEKPSISKRNKEIVSLVKQGLTIEEIAKGLKLEEEIVRKEIEHLTKFGYIETITASNMLSGKKADLQVEKGKVVVSKTTA